MAARKRRRVLLEVVRRPGSSADPSVRPRPVEPPPEPQRPVSTIEYEPPPPARRPSAAPVDASNSDEPLIAVSRSTLVVAISAIVVLIFVSFSAGKMYGSRNPIPPADDAAGEDALVENESDGADVDAGDAQSAERPRPIAAREPERQPTTSADDASPSNEKTAPRPQVELHKGYHYVIVQHLGLRQDRVAEEIAKYLTDKGVPCATLTGNDIRVIALSRFLISQEDGDGKRSESQRADELLTRVREIGAQMNRDWAKVGRKGYTLSRAYLREFK